MYQTFAKKNFRNRKKVQSLSSVDEYFNSFQLSDGATTNEHTVCALASRVRLSVITVVQSDERADTVHNYKT